MKIVWYVFGGLFFFKFVIRHVKKWDFRIKLILGH